MEPSQSSTVINTTWMIRRMMCAVVLKTLPLKGTSFKYMFRLAQDINTTRTTRHRADKGLVAGIIIPSPKAISKTPLE